MRRFALLLPLLGCWTSKHDRPTPPPHTTQAPRLEPVVLSVSETAGCPLAWDELEEVAPATIPLRDWPSPTGHDECPTDFDITAPCPSCESGAMANRHLARLEAEGPAGSGQFYMVGLAIDDARFACMMGSTVGWRHLYDFTSTIAPLQWLADVDHDGSRELIVWQRLSYGNSESDNGLVPIVYVLGDRALIRRDDRARGVAAPVAAAYRALAANGGDDAPCYTALAVALAR